MKDFNKVQIGQHNRKYRRPLYKEVNTTHPFAVSQPVLCQKVDGDSRVVGSFTDLLRLSPLPVPSYANLYKETYMRFVPISQVCPFYECVLTNTPYYSNGLSVKVDTLPYIDNRLLVYILCTQYSTYGIIRKKSDGWSYDTGYVDGDLPILQYFGNFTGGDSELRKLVPFEYYLDSLATISSSDFLLYLDDNTILCCRLTPIGRILRSNLIGLGFSLSVTDTTKLSILPLFAYYKSYFDTYYPNRTIQWTDTSCYKLIMAIANSVSNPYHIRMTFFDFQSNSVPDTKFEKLFVGFFEELSQTFATSSLDFVSACRDTPETASSSVGYNDGSSQILSANDGNLPSYSGNTFTHISLRALKYLTKFVSKSSVIGQKLTRKLSQLYQIELSNSLLFDTYSVGYYRMDVKINPIYSTSDTVDGPNGEYLGSFAGSGFSFKGDNKFDFSTKEVGYLIGFSSVIPDAEYFEGNAYDLCAIDRDTLFNSQYDAMGYEVVPYSSIVSDKGIGTKPAGSGQPLIDMTSGFGYLPRYSSLKSVKNTVNGDMSRRGTFDTLSAYYCDKVISTYSLSESVSKVSEDGTVYYNLVGSSVKPPQASEEWQFISKYPWIGQYDRIFYNRGRLVAGVGPADVEDPFMSQMSFNYSVFDNKLPVSRSYCTYDEDDNMITVKNE